MLDIIGDIHGHADELEELLLKLGYKKQNGIYSHPESKVAFIGDYIDRGPKIRETLEIVKSMVESGNAIALMGNHEYNAICFHYKNDKGGHLRDHSIKNIEQHFKTLEQFKNRQDEYEEYIEWFKTLPLFYETESIRAVHACWENKTIEYLRSVLIDNKLTQELIHESVKKDTKLYQAIDQTLKGREMDMPNGLYFHDKDGNHRDRIRIKWWENPVEMTYKSISIIDIDNLPEIKIGTELSNSFNFYKPDEKIVFFGHYWLKGDPKPFKENVVCLDYSVAKDGKLVSYRYSGEQLLIEENYTSI